MSAQTGVAGALNGGGDGYGATGERGSRRKKLAGYLKAANELRQSYRDTYTSRGANDGEAEHDDASISGAFPELVVARSGVDEMVLFPSYARRHTKKEKPKPFAQGQYGAGHETEDNTGTGDAEYWRREWEVYEDANAIVDVDIRGWIYSQHSGPMTRKNRLLFGIARHLSGIPAPGSQNASRATSKHRDRASEREEEMVEKEVQQITERGKHEADIAGRGGYSEGLEQSTDTSSLYSQMDKSRPPSPSSEQPRPGDFPHPVTNTSLSTDESDVPVTGGPLNRSSWSQPADMNSAQLSAANNHLMNRLKPFLTTPSVNMPLTIFFYNDHTSQSRTTHTNDAGHFNLRAALDFVPTHVRVLASSDLSATEEVLITEPTGISLISDIDDTIKHSAIGSGAKEIFRNTFIRDLGDLTVEGVKEWYNRLFGMDVKLHYVSNAPWQLYPVLVSYFALAGLPPGSFHLKQYTGMLQGIFEPVAERKKGTLNRIMSDFPERRFILVGDSGEADLELYTDIVLAHPGRVLGVFIRDVTTTPGQGFFDSSMGPLSGGGARSTLRGRRSNGAFSSNGLAKTSESRPTLPPRPLTEAPTQTQPHSAGPIMGDLIDFDDDPEPLSPRRSDTEPTTKLGRSISNTSSKSSPPERPSKPLALRGFSTDAVSTLNPSPAFSTNRKGPAPPPKPRKYSSSQEPHQPAEPSPLSQAQSTSPLSSRANSLERQTYRAAVKNKVASAYNALPSPVAYWHGTTSATTSPTTRSGDARRSQLGAPIAAVPPPVPPRRNITSYPAAAAQYATNRLGFSGDEEVNATSPLNKKEELWKRRWARAKDILDEHGVMLRAWRVGNDVMIDAIRLVERAKKEDLGDLKDRYKDRG
ncbi:hypothetical protein MMC26_005751 [Xylographa opegraphella]|nr:hypothetical protein [Xylographa opegraphella]